MRRFRLEMMKLLRKLTVLGMLGIFTVGAFAQGRGGDKRPPKDPGKVVTPDRKNPPPPPKKNDRPKGDKKKP